MVVAAVSRASPLTSIRKLFAPRVRAEAEPLSSDADNEGSRAGLQIPDLMTAIDRLRRSTQIKHHWRMSASDYNDPSSKLKLRFRPLRGSSTLVLLAAGLSMFATIICLIAFLATFLPGAEVSGSSFLFLAGAAVFVLGAGVFYAAHRFLRRFR